MSENTLFIGIDLGTSNSVLAFWDTEQESPNPLLIPQVEEKGRLKKQKTLPSVLYLPATNEVTPSDVALPWQSAPSDLTLAGAWAKDRAGGCPDRAVTSAKSWLCNAKIDRTSSCLPWQSDTVTQKLSPIAASIAFLKHLKSAFLHHQDNFADRSQKRKIVLTVPASFDEIARRFTHEAAIEAGLGEDVILLEEPQAALYAYISSMGKQWQKHLKPNDIILICDVGGGTTDFSLIVALEEKGQLNLERISVGNHLLLGGDNMDLALAYTLSSELEEKGNSLDHWQFLSLVQKVRDAKEKYFMTDESLDEIPIAIESQGKDLFSNTITAKLSKHHIETVLLEGFFPLVSVEDLPQKRKATSIREFGLDYETEAAITKHLAYFLKQSTQKVKADDKLRELLKDQIKNDHPLLPTTILFNGGIFKAKVLRSRILKVLNSWSDDKPIRELGGNNLDLAVALGGAYYSKIRHSGKGIKIHSGTARSYYLGVESSMMAVPGIRPSINGLCIVPQGTLEGTKIELKSKVFGLVTGEESEFRFFSSNIRAQDKVGTVISNATGSLEELSKLTLKIPALNDGKQETVPVTLDADVTEVGTLRLFMHHTQSDKKWDLEFNVREES